MNASALPHQTALDVERPSLLDLQRAQCHALRDGDRGRAAMIGVLVQRRVADAQRAASAGVIA